MRIQRLGAISLLSWMVLLLSACQQDISGDVKAALAELPAQIDFNQHVKPILSDRCFACHGPDKAKQKAGLRLDIADAAYSALPENPGKKAIVPGRIHQSEVYHRILSDDEALVMPPSDSDLTLSAYEKAVIIKWIQQGAEYQPHWAFIPPQKASLPTDLAKGEAIDFFIEKKQSEKGLISTSEASKEILLRRISFDLTGLPPSLDEINNFMNDTSPDAYEDLVDRLLERPQYGEHMAADWMDVARFADTHGYTVDRYRDMSMYRDWVIDAFNKNLPYEDFVTWQMAGDLLPDPSRDQLIATAFNRLHQQNMEGGIVQEEFRVEYVADRTNTLGAAFLGLTLECARCHDHKYDPISQKNYYELFSYFNNVKEAGQISWDNAMPVPTMLITDAKIDSIVNFLDQKIESEQRSIAAKIESLQYEQDSDSIAIQLSKLRSANAVPKGLVAHFSFDNRLLVNRLDPRNSGQMKQSGVNTAIDPEFSEGDKGLSLQMDGDAWLDLGNAGVFERHESFSIGIDVHLPSSLENGVIFHKGDGAAIYNFRGYHLAVKDNQLEMMMAHTEPYNAIIEIGPEIPRNEWVHLLMTYDGSSKANGLKLYVNGVEVDTKVDQDKLYKSILFGRSKEPGLQIGARWRGIGIKRGKVDDIKVFDRTLTALEALKLGSPEKFQQVIAKEASDLSESEIELLSDHIAHNESSQDLYASLEETRKQRNTTTDTLREIMIMQEMNQPRPTYILERGQYNAYGESVSPEVPSAILPMSDETPANRLGLAQWLMHKDHPLTSRVFVNRLWQHFFGQGLVKTAEDFGNQGDLPSHPALLDWLALEFMESEWDIKHMVKLIVMSKTYRQSSIADQKTKEIDPENIYLARGPAMRLRAEILRDNVLSASGLLADSIGGPSVKPYQPEGLWSINGGRYQEGKGDELYRRSLYTFWKRTVPNPTQATFDTPNRDICSVRRQKTSTPLQSLVLLNDPVFLEAARAIGADISLATSLEEGVEDAFMKLTARKPSKEEVQLLLELQKVELSKFEKDKDRRKGWLAVGQFQASSTIDPNQLAANTVVASTIINADATLIKR